MADASTVGKEVTTPLTQGYGALEFASDRDQRLHPSFVLVPQYTDWAVQDDWSTTDEVEMTIRLLDAVCKEYNVDTSRLYTPLRTHLRQQLLREGDGAWQGCLERSHPKVAIRWRQRLFLHQRCG